METVADRKKSIAREIKRRKESLADYEKEAARRLEVLKALGGIIHKQELEGFFSREVYACSRCGATRASNKGSDKCKCGGKVNFKKPVKRPISRQMVDKIVSRGELRRVPGNPDFFSLEDAKEYLETRKPGRLSESDLKKKRARIAKKKAKLEGATKTRKGGRK